VLGFQAFALSCGSSSASREAPPRAEFEVSRSSGSVPLHVQFLDRSSGTVTSWEWDFGDGSTSVERSPTHAYVLEGHFDVRLRVSGPGGGGELLLASAIEARAPERNALEYGMNPSFQRWSSREIVFADAMQRATEFLIVRGDEISMDPAPLIPLGRTPPRVGEGWPDFGQLLVGEHVGARLFGAMEGTLPDGRAEPWVLTWEGTGACRLTGTAVVREERRPRRVEVRVDPERGNGNGTVTLEIESSTRSDPVRNVHVWLPGMAVQRPLFWPPYLARVQAMNGGAGPHVWRTLDWTQVNEYGALAPPLPFVFDWAGRIRPTSPSQGTRRGMCPEFQAAFCNRVGANLHLQVPHRADPMSVAEYERYLRDLFTRLRDGAGALPWTSEPVAGLAEDLTLTVELSNELWNEAFPSSRWMIHQAAARGLSVAETIAQELELVWRLADEVFAGRRTVRRFVGGHIADIDFAALILTALPSGTRVDALGPACYFRPRREAIARWLEGASADACPNCPSPDEVIAAAWSSFVELRAGLRAHRALADQYVNPDGTHPRLELYECGQGFIADGAPWAEAARRAQVLPAMYRAYVDGLIPLLVEEGVELVNWYSFMTDQDPQHGVDVGFGIWNDMRQTLTLPVVEPYLDEGLPKAAAVYRGPPRR
jgi:PKD repeat protein